MDLPESGPKPPEQPDAPAIKQQPPARPRARLRALVAIICWTYLAVLIGLWIFLRIEGDKFWPATVLLFGPRWAWAGPIPFLLPAAAIFRRRSLWVLLLAALVVVGPIMGLRLPFRRLANSGWASRVRVLTCNTHNSALDVTAMKKVIAETRPDVVALQECSTRAQLGLFTDGGWYIAREGELCLASRYEIRSIRVIDAPSPGPATCFELSTPDRNTFFINLHLGSPHVAFDAMIHREPGATDMVDQNSEHRLRQSQAIRAFAEKLPGPVLLAGDFNSPPDGLVYRKSWGGMCNAFSWAGWGFGYTYWHGKRAQVRIDHILGTPGWQCSQCWVGPYVGSMHRPLIADMEWVGK